MIGNEKKSYFLSGLSGVILARVIYPRPPCWRSTCQDSCINQPTLFARLTDTFLNRKDLLTIQNVEKKNTFLYKLPNIWKSWDEIRMLFVIVLSRTASERVMTRYFFFFCENLHKEINRVFTNRPLPLWL